MQTDRGVIPGDDPFGERRRRTEGVAEDITEKTELLDFFRTLAYYLVENGIASIARGSPEPVRTELGKGSLLLPSRNVACQAAGFGFERSELEPRGFSSRAFRAVRGVATVQLPELLHPRQPPPPPPPPPPPVWQLAQQLQQPIGSLPSVMLRDAIFDGSKHKQRVVAFARCIFRPRRPQKPSNRCHSAIPVQVIGSTLTSSQRHASKLAHSLIITSAAL